MQKELGNEEHALTSGMKNFVHPGAGFRETAEIVSALDLVISVDTVWAHCAGALGKPVWILLPFAPDWRWLLDREDSPWYPTARLFRQPKIGDWDSVIDQVKHDLSKWSGSNQAPSGDHVHYALEENSKFKKISKKRPKSSTRFRADPID